MKKFNYLFGILLSITFTFLASCGGEKENTENTDNTDYLLRVDVKEGESYIMELDMHTETESEEAIDIQMQALMSYNVESVTEDEINMGMIFNSLKMYVGGAGDEISYDSENSMILRCQK